MTPEQKRTERQQVKAKTLEKLRRESAAKKRQLSAWKLARSKEQALKEQEQVDAMEKEKRKRRRQGEERTVQKEEIAMYRLQREAEVAHQTAVQKVLATARGHVVPGARVVSTSSNAIRQRHARDMLKMQEKKNVQAKKSRVAQEKRAKRLEITKNVNKRVNCDFDRLTRHTTASAHNALTPEKLDQLDVQRKSQHGGHNARLYGHTGAEFSRGRTYTMSKASTLKVPAWRKAARR